MQKRHQLPHGLLDQTKDSEGQIAGIECLLIELQRTLQSRKIRQFNRRVPFGDLITERDNNAMEYGFGEGTTMYDSALVIGDVKVGRHTWIGPNVILDGSGGSLEIGDFCSIDAGVQIYTHDSVKWAFTGGRAPYERSPTRIGNRCFIGPNSVIAKGVTIGDGAAIGALSFVSRDVPAGCLAVGSPARIIQRKSQCTDNVPT